MKQINGKELIRLLRKHGWETHSSKGSHFKLKKPGCEHALIIPIHGNKPLKSGILSKILRDAGISIKEL